MPLGVSAQSCLRREPTLPSQTSLAPPHPTVFYYVLFMASKPSQTILCNHQFAGFWSLLLGCEGRTRLSLCTLWRWPLTPPGPAMSLHSEHELYFSPANSYSSITAPAPLCLPPGNEPSMAPYTHLTSLITGIWDVPVHRLPYTPLVRGLLVGTAGGPGIPA